MVRPVTHDPLNDPPEQILADAKRYREDAMQQLAAIEAGKTVPAMVGRTRQDAIDGLMKSIAEHETVMRHYGWKGDNA
jgi:hypothetical protein